MSDGDGIVRQHPVGAGVTLQELACDPYPVYARLRATEPVSWIPSLGMWYVTSYEDVRTIILDVEHFTTASEHSLIFDTFGAQMLTTEGAEHNRYRSAVQHAFLPGLIRRRLEHAIHTAARRLVADFRSTGAVELREAFARRLPVHTMLLMFGLPDAHEGRMRRWYDGFEKALSNFDDDTQVRNVARDFAAELDDYLTIVLEQSRQHVGASLTAELVNAPQESRLTDSEIKRNMAIIFFGGISTVEALILNGLWALFTTEGVLDRVRRDSSLLPKAIDETLRWLSPVQSATRHVVTDMSYKGIPFEKGQIVNCMLGAANRDPAVFPEPDQFLIDRPNAQRHLGFATGVHSCLGFNLAKVEARIGLACLLEQLPDLQLLQEDSSVPRGHEFRQPQSMQVAWQTL